MTISATERRELRGLALTVFGGRGADLLMAGLAHSDLEAMVLGIVGLLVTAYQLGTG